jgi:hypothetical protein
MAQWDQSLTLRGDKSGLRAIRSSLLRKHAPSPEREPGLPCLLQRSTPVISRLQLFVNYLVALPRSGFSCGPTDPSPGDKHGLSPLCLQKPNPHVISYQSPTRFAGSTFSRTATALPSPRRQAWAFLRFVFRNRIHNVICYQSPNRFAGSTFSDHAEPTAPASPSYKHGLSPLCFQKPNPQCHLLSITYSLCRGPLSHHAERPAPSRQATSMGFLRFVFRNRIHNVFCYQSPRPIPPLAPVTSVGFLRFVFGNRIHNVICYQLPTRFAGVHFSHHAERPTPPLR